MKINHILFAILFTGLSLSIQAQKFGYLNSQVLLAELPEVKAADAEIQALQTQLEQEAELGKFEQQMQKDVLEKRQSKLQPVIDKVNNAIKMVATENQFNYIFDSSAGILLYAQESMDVTSLVKTKLGI